MEKKELIIFDMDGTLIDSGNVITNTINYVRNNIGLVSIPKDEMLEHLNNPDINAAKFFYGTSAFTDKQTKLFGEYYDENCIKDILLYTGIREMLKSIESDFILSVATNASVEFANKMLHHLDIHNHFDMVIGANNVQKPKPHPDMLLETLRKFNISYNKSVLVGDSLKDKRAAEAANIDTILVNWGFSNHNAEDAISSVSILNKKLLDLR